MGPDLDPEALGAQARHEVWMRYEKFDNFQKLLRTMLACEGSRFEQAENLASKCNAIMRFARDSGKISKNLSYDWGLRFQKKLVRSFGGYKSNTDASDESCLLGALNLFSTATLTMKDVSSLKNASIPPLSW